MRLFTGLTFIVLTACASGNAPLGSTDKSINMADGSGGALRIRGSDGPKVTTLAFPVDKVWRALPAVYDSLGIVLTDLNPATHVIGNSGMKVHKTLGKVSLAKYIDCGATQGFPSAESYDIQMVVKSQVEATDGGTSLGTLVEAAGRPMAFAGEFVRCSTKGELENRIADAVKRALSP